MVDDPLLTVRYPGADDADATVPMQTSKRLPARVILDSEAGLSPRAKLFRDVEKAPVVIFVGEEAREDAVSGLRNSGARVERLPTGPGGLSVEEALKRCWELEIRSVFCEGGGRLASTLLAAGLVQRLYLFVAPFVLGEKGVSAFPNLAGSMLWETLKPSVPPGVFGRDVLLTFDRVE
jgi:diaminohydroxyphosphoribosylaminopyrimidine deaminase/5-amino-6-(5-phosphoribosylamino)uracil reductase